MRRGAARAHERCLGAGDEPGGRARYGASCVRGAKRTVREGRRHVAGHVAGRRREAAVGCGARRAAHGGHDGIRGTRRDRAEDRTRRGDGHVARRDTWQQARRFSRRAVQSTHELAQRGSDCAHVWRRKTCRWCRRRRSTKSNAQHALERKRRVRRLAGGVRGRIGPWRTWYGCMVPTGRQSQRTRA